MHQRTLSPHVRTTSHLRRDRPARLTGWLLVLLGVLAFHGALDAAEKPAPAPAALQGASGSKGLIARALVAEGARELGSAVELLTTAYRQSPLPEVLYHLGRIALAEGRQLEAHDLFRRYLADPARQVDDTATRTAEQLIAQRPPPCGSVNVLSDPGALVIVDEHLAGTLPLPLPLLLSPGAHKVTLEFLDKRLESQVDVQVGRLIELRITRASGAVLLSVVPAILHLVEAPALPESTTRLFVDTLEQAARVEAHTLLETAPALVAAPKLATCLAEDGCRRQLAQRNGAEMMLRQRTHVEPITDGAAFKSALTLWRTNIAAPAGTVEVTCAPCDAKQAAAKLKIAVARLFADGLSRPFGTLALTTEPPDAEVRLDAQPLLRNDAPATVWATTHSLSVRRRGYTTEQREIVISDGKEASVHVQLQRGVDREELAPPSRAEGSGLPLGRPRWRLALGGTLLSLGVGLAITGAVGLAKNGQCVEAPAIENAACPRLFTTQTAGAIGIGLGAGLIGGGIALIAIPARRPVRTAKTSTQTTAR